MEYQLNADGKALGAFPLEELRRRRLNGELNGKEFVWREGMPAWQTLDSLLIQIDGPRAVSGLAQHKLSRWVTVAVVLAVLSFIGLMGYSASTGFRAARTAALQNANRSNPDSKKGVNIANKPIVWSTNSATLDDVNRVQKEFRMRQYLEAFRQHGAPGKPWATNAELMIQSWLQSLYGGDQTNLPDCVELGDKLAADPSCQDPVVLTVEGLTCGEKFEGMRRLQRALDAFQNSSYKAYPRLIATVKLADLTDNDVNDRALLDAAAADLLLKTCQDGSLTKEDQPVFADGLLFAWGENFFKRQGPKISKAAQSYPADLKWLRLIISGEQEITDAWKARGGGYANSVTDTGWQGFNNHLATARKELTEAWNLQPRWPLAACSMMRVSLGDSGGEEMREWFDRVTALQIDYSGAWSSMRWGLRPRWYGSLEAMKDFGVAAVNTGRFDTSTPRKFLDVVSDLEEETTKIVGAHPIYGRADLWPVFQRMYEGYISLQTNDDKGWRAEYAVVAYFARHYDVARQQLEKIDWKIPSPETHGWGTDLTLMPLEVAARTGASSSVVEQAEKDATNSQPSRAAQAYEKIAAGSADDQTKKFAEARLGALKMDEKLDNGDWVNFVPATQDDPNWKSLIGKYKKTGGDIEVEAGRRGHLILCETAIGPEFEVEGQFDVVKSSNDDFQAGVVFGLPNLWDNNWFSFRLKHNKNEGAVSSIAVGWGASRYTKAAAVRDDHNTFRLRIHAGTATAWLNGQRIYNAVALPGYIRACTDDYRVGLGAFNDMNETIIRYHDVRIRRLIPGKMPPEARTAS